MRIATISAIGLILASSSAWAQSSYSDSNRSDTYGYQNQSDRSSADGYRHHWERGGDRDRDRWHDDDHHGKRSHARGASLYLKAGEREFRVDCGDDDSTRECVDAALLMFREMHGATSTSSNSTTPGASTPTPPGTGGGSSTNR